MWSSHQCHCKSVTAVPLELLNFSANIKRVLITTKFNLIHGRQQSECFSLRYKLKFLSERKIEDRLPYKILN